MPIYRQIALRYLKSRYSFGFVNFSTILSIIGLTFGISSIIIILSISEAFSEMISFKLSQIDGHLRINKINDLPISKDQIEYIQSLLSKSDYDIRYIAEYYEKYGVLRKNGATEGVIIYFINNESLNKIFNLNNFSYIDSNIYFSNTNSIIIGQKLSEIFDTNIGDTLIFIDYDNILYNSDIIANNLIIDGIFKTNFPEYDKMLVFFPIESFHNFRINDYESSGIIINLNNYFEIDKLASQIKKILVEYNITTWTNRHHNLLSWLKVYDAPIKIVMIFISIIAIFNIASSLWLIFINKKKEYSILMALGLKFKEIKKIIIFQGFIISIISSFHAIIISLILIYIQKKFHIITLPEDVYFTSSLPINLNIYYFLLIPLFAILITVIFSIITAFRSTEINISKELKYE